MLARIKRAVKRLLIRNPRRANYKFVLRDWTSLSDLPAAARVLETKRFTRNLDPVVMDRPDAARLLVVAPHPDDDTFGAGGTLLLAADAGAEVRVIYVTDGHDDPDVRDRVRDEARRVCKALGAQPVFLGHAPRHIPLGGDAGDVAARLRREMEDFAPDAVLVPFLLDDHDDHRRVNEALLRAFDGDGKADAERTDDDRANHDRTDNGRADEDRTDDDRAGADGPKRPAAEAPDAEVWGYQVYSTVLPNVVVDVTEAWDRKEALMRTWQSVQGDRDWLHYVRGMNAANCRYLPTAEPAYAETFFVVPLAEYLDLCRTYFDGGRERVYYDRSYRGNMEAEG